jgi:hypothetical protein
MYRYIGEPLPPPPAAQFQTMETYRRSAKLRPVTTGIVILMFIAQLLNTINEVVTLLNSLK